MAPRASRLLVPAVLALALTGCGGQGVSQVGDYTLFVHRRTLLPQGGLMALIQGTLAVREGCVGLENEEFDTWYPVVWPAGTTIRSTDPLVIRLPGRVEVAVGDAVSGGGGFLQQRHIEATIPDECLPSTDEVAVFNASDRVTKVEPD